MYCVKCGVELQDGAKKCPLCETPVLLYPMTEEEIYRRYSDLYPKENHHERYLFLSILTALFGALVIACLIFCLGTYGHIAWGGFVMLGLALLWIQFILPAWFPKWMPLVFIPIDFLALSAYLLYICLKLGGNWYLSFAFPITMIAMLLTTGLLLLTRLIKKGRLILYGGFTIFVGCSFMLVEMFQHITFGTPMFQWSLYCVVVFSLIGIFFILAGIIPTLKEYLKRKFFL